MLLFKTSNKKYNKNNLSIKVKKNISPKDHFFVI